ncbi:hypothetical protein [Micromonospora sp. NPDC005203]|uniref:hypothetical protein n=1 Tax=Micromonospora sp. NPDC005203 TaxID=3364226 RepID=UPI0036C249E1
MIGDAEFHLAMVLERVQHHGRTLDRIDPYGLLVVTSVAMPQFLGELNVLVEQAEGGG